MTFVWFDVLMFDSKKAAQKAQRILSDDPRIRPFWDPEKLSGEAIARSLGWDGTDFAWDIYLFYDRDAVWSDHPPEPFVFMHQLTDRGDQEGYHTGEDLAAKLRETMAKLIGR